ncbi:MULTISPECIES: DUF3226 domain-containing protein [unclassified Marinitoga]|uniref:DUF3226 domain-containing protein n=1 Tax=unclassified Marinitoga TaxID=2640159 RepID=UPI000640C6C2|nr:MULTISPECIES: DUF3226 domain-containing protein [unclassified Marinitoga]KLO21237.1 hypothetical protein X274_11175 [Marinitoga sp. 1155]NUU99573.1 hypothetical protein [Marinitoga sp. 1154]
MNQKIESDKLLLVEGKDEENFLLAFLKHLNISNIQILTVQGKENFKKELKLITKFPDFEKIKIMGIVKDADNSFHNSLKSIVTILSNLGFQVNQDGSFSNGKPKIGIFIMPDHKSPGMLEDLCLSSIKEQKEIKCFEEFFICLNNNEITNFKNLSKSKTLAYLASQKEPVNSLGLAAKKGYWNFEKMEKLKNFLLNFV